MSNNIIQNKKFEYFHGGGLSNKVDEDKKLVSWPTRDEGSYTSQLFCRRKNLSKSSGKKITVEDDERHDRFYPKDGESEYGRFNPIWLILSLLNICLEIVLDLFSVFTFLFKIVFKSTFKELTSFDVGDLVGLNQGSKYCFNTLWFRYFVIILCPPAGVFLSYGFAGWLQILICALASLFYYFPGLVYALIVINRSSVGEYMRNVNSSECNDDMGGLGGGGVGLFVSDKSETKKCLKQVGDSCEPNSNNGNECCANPKLSDDKKTWVIQTSDTTVKEARTKSGKKVKGPDEGLVICRKDTKKIDVTGMCVWKENNKPG